MRKKIIAGNWKMNKTPSEAAVLASEIRNKISDAKCDVVVCPTAVCIPGVVSALEGSSISVGAQNVHFKESGAYTGELSSAMLKDAGTLYTIIGHSERRQYFGETDETVNLRTKAAVDGGLIPIVCVGESLSERENGIMPETVCRQTKLAFLNIQKDDAENIIIAYEPIWAIGTGKTATSEDANNSIKAIRGQIEKIYGKDVADEVIIQYGGSVKSANAQELFMTSDIDGALVGGASLKTEEFEKIVNYER